ncbi:sporulation histidine kinase inhibitor Sda [Halalkalibacillus halophilus]|nr:sporulation histidine kinase inhibitor Sda [Halalkalibacillus halophilus]
MDTLSNELLIESYKKAKKMQLNEDFIQLFEIELEKRGIIEHFKESS